MDRWNVKTSRDLCYYLESSLNEAPASAVSSPIQTVSSLIIPARIRSVFIAAPH